MPPGRPQLDVRVRPIAEADLRAVRDLLADWLIEAAGEAWEGEVESRITAAAASITQTNGATFFVAESRGEIFGVAALAPDVDDDLVTPIDRAAEVTTVYVRRDRIGRGVGAALIDWIEAAARALGYSHLIVVSGARHRALGYPFWTSRYGDPVRTDPDFFAPGAERKVWRGVL